MPRRMASFCRPMSVEVMSDELWRNAFEARSGMRLMRHGHLRVARGCGSRAASW